MPVSLAEPIASANYPITLRQPSRTCFLLATADAVLCSRADEANLMLKRRVADLEHDNHELRQENRELRGTKRELERELGGRPTDEELAATREKLKEARQRIAPDGL